MENVSKALIMAGSLLISLIILGALLLMFNNISAYQKTNVEKTRDEQVIEFNNQYETYNRTDVRGSDICSLMNKATDYNERKSSAGDEGAEISYTPIVINVEISNNLKSILQFSTKEEDGNYKLISNKNYLQVGKTEKETETENNFVNVVKNPIDDIEEHNGQTTMMQLVNNISNIYDNNAQNAQEATEMAYKKATGKKMDYNSIINLKSSVFKYYEYIQFKRAYFDCQDSSGGSGVKYDQNTGRIVEMNFQFNGKTE